MFCREGFTATGEVRLVGAHIGGQLNLSGASLTNPDGRDVTARTTAYGFDPNRVGVIFGSAINAPKAEVSPG